jgi:hypothetical protein
MTFYHPGFVQRKLGKIFIFCLDFSHPSFKNAFNSMAIYVKGGESSEQGFYIEFQNGMVSTNFSSWSISYLSTRRSTPDLSGGGGSLPVQQLRQFAEFFGGGDGNCRSQFTAFNHPPDEAVPLLCSTSSFKTTSNPLCRPPHNSYAGISPYPPLSAIAQALRRHFPLRGNR